VYAAELVRRDGGDPREPAPPAPDAPGALALTDWASTVGESDRDTEEYGYGTSFGAVDVLVDEIGFDRTRDVVNALRDGTSAYDVAVAGERPSEEWQRVYDAVVEIGEAVTTRDVFQARVVGPDGAGQIEARDRAATDVESLAQRSAPWSLPVGVRQRLERWEFGDVDEALAAAAVVLDRRAELEAIEATVGIDEPDVAGAAYGNAPMDAAGGVDFDEPTRVLDDQIAAGEQLVDRRERLAALAGPAQVTPPEPATLDGVDDFASALDAADAQLRAVEQLIDIEDRIDTTSGILARIGRWGSDIDGQVVEARAQLESGDTDAALDTLAAADAQLDDLDAIGALRLAIAAAALALLITVLVVLGRHRRSSRGRGRGGPSGA
jgi:hypothetical protein